MKKLKLLLATFIAITVMSISHLNAQTVIIRAIEFPMVYKSMMFVTDPNGETQTIELENLRKSMDKAIANNNVIIQTQINNWKNEGYFINGISNYAMGDGMVTMIILSKKE